MKPLSGKPAQYPFAHVVNTLRKRERPEDQPTPLMQPEPFALLSHDAQNRTIDEASIA